MSRVGGALQEQRVTDRIASGAALAMSSLLLLPGRQAYTSWSTRADAPGPNPPGKGSVSVCCDRTGSFVALPGCRAQLAAVSVRQDLIIDPENRSQPNLYCENNL